MQPDEYGSTFYRGESRTGICSGQFTKGSSTSDELLGPTGGHDPSNHSVQEKLFLFPAGA